MASNTQPNPLAPNPVALTPDGKIHEPPLGVYVLTEFVFCPRAGLCTHEAGHEHEEYDPHVWLNTANAKVMAAVIEKTLVEADPSNAQIYAKNLANLDDRLDKLSADIKSTIAPVKDKPFIVFHDAYQYFEKEFGVTVAGSITVSDKPVTVPEPATVALALSAIPVGIATWLRRRRRVA